MNVDIRKVGIWMLGVGCVAASVGLVGDAVRHANDPTLSSREGIFDLSGWPHALFFGGICLALIGLFAMLVGPEIYKPGSKLTVGRRLAQVGAPLAAVVLVAGCAAITSNSTLADPSADPHAVADAVGGERRDDRHDRGERSLARRDARRPVRPGTPARRARPTRTVTEP